jgi:hypothetical protein
LRWGARDPITGRTFAGTYDGEAIYTPQGTSWPQVAGVIDLMPGFSFDPDADPPPPKGTHVVLWAEVVGQGDVALHSGEIEVVIGDTVTWDPCAENPDRCQNG